MSDRTITETICGGLTIRRRVIPCGLKGPWIDFLIEESRWCEEFGRRVLGPMLVAEADRVDGVWSECGDCENE